MSASSRTRHRGACAAFGLGLLALLAGCASAPRRAPESYGGYREPAGGAGGRYAQAQDGGPGAPPIDVNAIPEPVPKVEPRSRFGNAPTYTVNGRTYHVLASAAGYDERGIASWYGNKFQGYLTSSLEPYDMYKFTAASKVLPLPSYARVTNLANGRSVIVRVNDRGPFVANRIIDLSYAAAVKIGIWAQGTGLVEVQGIDPSRPQDLPAPPAVAARGAAPVLYLQVGAFAERANAARVAARLRQAGFDNVHVTEAVVHGRRVLRVRLGPLRGVAEADRLSPRVQALGLPEPQVAVDTSQ